MNSPTGPKILLATRAIESPPHEGGLVLLKDLGTELVRQGMDVTMFSSTTQPAGSIKKLKIFTENGWGRLARYQFLWGLFRRVADFDIVHLAHVPTAVSARLIGRIARRAAKKGTRFVQTVTGLPVITEPDIARLLWGDTIVCQSQEIAAMVRSAAPSRSSRLILPWPAPQRVTYSQERRSVTRAAYLAGKEKLVVFPGELARMGVGEDFGGFVDALIANKPSVRLVLACRFDRAGIGRRLAKRYPDNVVSLGQVPDIISLIEAADLVIFPTKKIDSKFHPPLVLMEALQLGTPVLASSLTGLSEKLGIDIVRVTDPETAWPAFADEAAKLLAKPVDRTSGHYDRYFTAMTQAYQQVYRTLGDDN
ncbi:MAG: glycosyltransferase family 4 protein [Patescibacteria group bacterium]